MRIQRITAWRLAALLLVALGTSVPGGAALAQTDVYTVEDIPVDVTEEDAASARVTAHAQGHDEAFKILLARLVPAGQLELVTPVLPEQIATFVQEFSVAGERTSAVRYLADLTFQFNPEAVRQFLRQQEIPFAESRGEPLVVLPVFGTGGGARLWRDPNPWRTAWVGQRLAGELVPMIVPLGDLDDVSAVTARLALDGAVERMDAVARRYGATEVLVTQLRLTGDTTAGRGRAEVMSRRYSGFELQSFRSSFSQQAEEPRRAFLRRAVRGVVAEIQESWKQANLLRFGEESTLMATVPLRSLGEWIEVKRRLDRIPLVVASDLTNLTRAKADVQITFIGDQNQLARTLAQSDLLLTPDVAEGWWELILNAAIRPAVTPAVAPADSPQDPE